MKIQERINAFVQLGKFLGQFTSEIPQKKEHVLFNDSFFEEMLSQINLAKINNGWFSEQNIAFAFKSWSEALDIIHLEKWISNYSIPEHFSEKTIAIVMAGNVPLVGFHDFLSALISGNKVLVKLSSNDKILLPFISKYLCKVAPSFSEYIQFTEGKLPDFDAVIATGSNNTARYFDHYFNKYPNIIRKNRNSVAVLSGTESKEQMEALAKDIFQYFGLGCRNVSKIYIPEGYDFAPFFNGMYSWKHIINDTKYINNYDYNKAVYLMSNVDLLDNEFMLLKEDTGFSSPISVVFYEYYSSQEQLQKTLTENNLQIQCVVSELGIKNEIHFGKAQTPRLWDYADQVDTMAFLINL